NSLLRGRERLALEHDVLPPFLFERRWFADKAYGVPATRLQAIIPLERSGVSAALAFVDVPAEKRSTARYLLPLIVQWTRLARAETPHVNAVAAVRRGPRVGTLVDASGDQDFVVLLLQAIHSGAAIAQGECSLECRPTSAFAQLPPPLAETITVPS